MWTAALLHGLHIAALTNSSALGLPSTSYGHPGGHPYDFIAEESKSVPGSGASSPPWT